MRNTNNKTILSATDLSNHIACKHATELERRYADGTIEKPARKNHFLDRIIERGIDHEAAYLAHLKQRNNLNIVEFTHDKSNLTAKTIDAMKAGADVIFQASLANEQWAGRPDFLIKVDLNSPGFDNWSYEVVDTKLTQTTKAGTIIQLCVYSDLLAELQGIPPVQLHVVMPNNDPHTPFQKEF